MNKKQVWSVASAYEENGCNSVVLLATFLSICDALEYAAFVTEYDEDTYFGWTTYIIEGDFINV